MEWRTIESAPRDGFFLVYERGAIRTMFRYKGEWSLPDIPVLVNEFGDSMVSAEVRRAYGKTLEISHAVSDPTHWMPLPNPPSEPK